MRVVCIASSAKSLPRTCLDEAAGISLTSEFPVTVGATYVVYAITTFRGHSWYYIFDDNNLPYPVWKLAPLFEVSDPSLPTDWIIGYVRPNRMNEGSPILSFPEWVLDRTFYERLVDGNADAVSIFATRRVSAETVARDIVSGTEETGAAQ